MAMLLAAASLSAAHRTFAFGQDTSHSYEREEGFKAWRAESRGGG